MVLYTRYYLANQSNYSTPSEGGAGATPYADLVASLGAVSYWPLQDTSGTDEIGGHTLTWSGGTPSTGTGPGGELSSAIVLAAASNQWGGVAHADHRPTTALTVIGWINVTTYTNGAAIWCCGDSGFDGYMVQLESSRPGMTARVKNGTDTNNNLNGYNDATTGVWRFVAQTYDKANQRLYFNGSAVTGSPSASTFDIGYGGDESFQVGTLNSSTTLDFDGLVAGYAMFATALTAENISNLYSAVVG